MKLSRCFILILVLFPALVLSEEINTQEGPEYWREKLTAEQFEVCREGGTERAFSGEYTEAKGKGTYHCSSCGQKLFNSDAKFDSGTGWPSFTGPMTSKTLLVKDDFSHGMHRKEVLCSKCNAHLGHVFNDGPGEKGKRYCINSVCLQFIPEEN